MRGTPLLFRSVLIGALVVTGCGSAPVTDPAVPDPVTDPAAPDPGALVLRTQTVGGFAGLGGPGTPPDVSVYGSGRVVAKDGGWATEYHLNRAALQRLLDQAREAGLGTPRTIEDPRIADALYAEITYAPPGHGRSVTKVVKDGDRGGAAAAFAARLDPKAWPSGDLTGAAEPYRPKGIAVLSVESVTGGGDAEAWPFGTSLGSGTQVAAWHCTVLPGTETDRVRRLAERPGTWRQDGRAYRVTFRPLLPDEPDCAALNA